MDSELRNYFIEVKTFLRVLTALAFCTSKNETIFTHFLAKKSSVNLNFMRFFTQIQENFANFTFTE